MGDPLSITSQTALAWAAGRGHEAVVQLQLLDKGIESRADKGRTLLSYAAEEGHEAVVKLLLDKDADTEAKDKWGRTSLSWAVVGSYEAVVQLLQALSYDIIKFFGSYSYV